MSALMSSLVATLVATSPPTPSLRVGGCFRGLCAARCILVFVSVCIAEAPGNCTDERVEDLEVLFSNFERMEASVAAAASLWRRLGGCRRIVEELMACRAAADDIPCVTLLPARLGIVRPPTIRLPCDACTLPAVEWFYHCLQPLLSVQCCDVCQCNTSDYWHVCVRGGGTGKGFGLCGKLFKDHRPEFS